MKIAQITHNYLPHIGGIEFYVKRIVDSLNKKGVHTEVLTTNMSTPETGRKTEATYFNTSFQFMRNPFSLGFIKHLKKSEYDILHLHSAWFLHCLIAVYFRKNAKIITSIHGVYPDNANWKLKFFLKLYRPFVSYVLRKSEKIIVYSDIEKKKLENIFKMPPGKIEVLPMAINIEEYEDRKKEQVILFTGRIIPDKNPEVLVKAAALLNARFKDYKLVFVGSIEDRYKQKLIDLSKNLLVKNEINFIGQLDPSIEQEKKELLSYYMNASVFVSLGSWEGQPTRLMEAMQFKTPVIAFAAGGTADFVIDNKNGFVIGELDEKLLADRLDRILSDKNLSEKFGFEARRTIENSYNWDNIFEKLFRIYTIVLK